MAKYTVSSRPFSFADKVALIWFALDAVTHLTMEASYLYLAVTVTAVKSDSPWAFIWKEYGKADSRWAIRDPTVISLEILTVLVAGPLAALLVYAIWTRKPYRHLLQVCISVMELYGGAMTFFPEFVEGSPNLSTSNPVYLWVYLVFMNILWVVLPLVLLWDSSIKITRACDIAKTENKDEAGAPGWSWLLSALFLLAYVILVPAVLLNTDKFENL
eukprot:m.136223 g.136223  ORF g.136223 m.136223 type:complete len:216 (-) comp23943_c0_seq2:118-765(-)